MRQAGDGLEEGRWRRRYQGAACPIITGGADTVHAPGGWLTAPDTAHYPACTIAGGAWRPVADRSAPAALVAHVFRRARRAGSCFIAGFEGLARSGHGLLAGEGCELYCKTAHPVGDVRFFKEKIPYLLCI